jgi:hypothetical protein
MSMGDYMSHQMGNMMAAGMYRQAMLMNAMSSSNYGASFAENPMLAQQMAMRYGAMAGGGGYFGGYGVGMMSEGAAADDAKDSGNADASGDGAVKMPVIVQEFEVPEVQEKVEEPEVKKEAEESVVKEEKEQNEESVKE